MKINSKLVVQHLLWICKIISFVYGSRDESLCDVKKWQVDVKQHIDQNNIDLSGRQLAYMRRMRELVDEYGEVTLMRPCGILNEFLSILTGHYKDKTIDLTQLDIKRHPHMVRRDRGDEEGGQEDTLVPLEEVSEERVQENNDGEKKGQEDAVVQGGHFEERGQESTAVQEQNENDEERDGLVETEAQEESDEKRRGHESTLVQEKNEEKLEEQEEMEVPGENDEERRGQEDYADDEELNRDEGNDEKMDGHGEYKEKKEYKGKDQEKNEAKGDDEEISEDGKEKEERNEDKKDDKGNVKYKGELYCLGDMSMKSKDSGNVCINFAWYTGFLCGDAMAQKSKTTSTRQNTISRLSFTDALSPGSSKAKMQEGSGGAKFNMCPLPVGLPHSNQIHQICNESNVLENRTQRQIYVDRHKNRVLPLQLLWQEEFLTRNEDFSTVYRGGCMYRFCRPYNISTQTLHDPSSMVSKKPSTFIEADITKKEEKDNPTYSRNKGTLSVNAEKTNVDPETTENTREPINFGRGIDIMANIDDNDKYKQNFKSCASNVYDNLYDRLYKEHSNNRLDRRCSTQNPETTNIVEYVQSRPDVDFNTQEEIVSNRKDGDSLSVPYILKPRETQQTKKSDNLHLEMVKLEDKLLSQSWDSRENRGSIDALEEHVLRLEQSLSTLNQSYAQLQQDHNALRQKQKTFTGDSFSDNKHYITGCSKTPIHTVNHAEMISKQKSRMWELSQELSNQTLNLQQMARKTSFIEKQNAQLFRIVMDQSLLISNILVQLQDMSENLANTNLERKDLELLFNYQFKKLSLQKETSKAHEEISVSKKDGGKQYSNVFGTHQGSIAMTSEIVEQGREDQLVRRDGEPLNQLDSHKETKKGDVSVHYHEMEEEKGYSRDSPDGDNDANVWDEAAGNLETSAFLPLGVVENIVTVPHTFAQEEASAALGKESEIPDESESGPISEENRDSLENMDDENEFKAESNEVIDVENEGGKHGDTKKGISLSLDTVTSDEPLPSGVNNQDSNLPIVAARADETRKAMEVEEPNRSKDRLKKGKKKTMARVEHSILYPPLHARKPADCHDLHLCDSGQSGPNKVFVNGLNLSVHVTCVMDEKNGWTVILRRQDGSQDFYKDYKTYKDGFGSPRSDHYLGNEVIHYLTNQKHYSLKVELSDWKGNTRHAHYDDFWIDGEDDHFRLHVQGYSGNAGDGLGKHNGMQFSTFDVDNDLVSETELGGSCARRFRGAGWYYRCYQSNVMGLYYPGPDIPEQRYDGLAWKPWLGPNYSLRQIIMSIRPKTLQ